MPAKKGQVAAGARGSRKRKAQKLGSDNATATKRAEEGMQEGAARSPELRVLVLQNNGRQTLDLSYCSRPEALPKSVVGLKGLRALNMPCCLGLKALPESLGKLTGLETR